MVSTVALHARVRGSVPGLGGFKETKMFLPHPRVKVSIVGSLRDREVACSASDRQGSNFESCVWRTVSSQSSHHPQVLLAQFSLYVHKSGLKPDSFHFSFSFVELKSRKIREKLGLAGATQPSLYPFFLNMYKKPKHTQRTYTRFFLNLTRPLSVGAAALVLHWVNVWLLRSRTAVLHNHGYPGVHHRGLGTARSTLAVSSSPRSWIHVFALP